MSKYVLFWLYLWQLKEYHAGRVVDHFRTSKGKKIIFDSVQIFKLMSLVFLLFTIGLFQFLFTILFFVYLVQSLIFFRNIYLGNLKKPKKTLKIIILSAISFAFLILLVCLTLGKSDTSQLSWLLSADVFAPLFVSFIVLLVQPMFVLKRNFILREAKIKLEKMKSISGLKVVAITGSYGKTSTKEFLSTILSKKFRVLATKNHQNSEIAIAKSISENLKPGCQIFIAEVGAYNRGKVKEVCEVLKPKIGIVTGVNEQHLSLFGSMENLLSAEGGGELTDALPDDGILIVNGDNKYFLDLYKNTDGGDKKIYSQSNKTINADIWADEISVSKDSVLFMAIDKQKNMAHFDVKVLGKHNVQNILAAILIARELGMSFEEISEACKDIKQEQAGMVLISGKHQIYIIDSSYSANPDGVFADLDYLSVFGQKKIIIMPCLIELGKKSKEIHEKIGKKISQVCDLAIITSKDKFKEIKKGALEGGMDEKNVLLCEKPDDIHSLITLFCKSGDVVLLEGRVPAGLINLLKN